ncbi:MAG: hypothetical protein AAB316_12095 [Bacteroidota bacterium]
MSQRAHKIYVATLASIVVIVFFYLLYQGLSYYGTSHEERFYHDEHKWLKPSGPFGHGLGIVGTLLIIIGVFGYMAKKKNRWLSGRFGRLKYWLEFHIFLCSLGPVMILFHTAFKFNGIVSVSFWSMVAVVASGVIGRFIYIQIPRTIEGRELNLSELKEKRTNVGGLLRDAYKLDEASSQRILSSTKMDYSVSEGNFFSHLLRQYLDEKKSMRHVKEVLRNNNLTGEDSRRVVKLVAGEISLNRRIERLQTMRKLFRYWHVAHLPFALIMLIIMVIHVAVTLAFGYRWIF